MWNDVVFMIGRTKWFVFRRFNSCSREVIFVNAYWTFLFITIPMLHEVVEMLSKRVQWEHSIRTFFVPILIEAEASRPIGLQKGWSFFSYSNHTGISIFSHFLRRIEICHEMSMNSDLFSDLFSDLCRSHKTYPRNSFKGCNERFTTLKTSNWHEPIQQ